MFNYRKRVVDEIEGRDALEEYFRKAREEGAEVVAYQPIDGRERYAILYKGTCSGCVEVLSPKVKEELEKRGKIQYEVVKYPRIHRIPTTLPS